jgi:inward rectifier potassium channel
MSKPSPRPAADRPAGKPMSVPGAAMEIRKSGISQFDFRDPYHFAVTISWGAFAAILLILILTINVIFAGLYLARPGAVQNLPPGDFPMAFFFSLETLATVGYGEMAPQSLYGHGVAGVEILIGMAFTAIMTGLLFVRFSKPRARFLFADKAVIATHNGKPTFMLRIANGRFTMLTHATAKVGILMAETTHEGQLYRGVHDLKLARGEIPIFPLTWTLMHVIDETSPLHGLDAKDLARLDARFFLAVDARDTALGALVQDIRNYPHEKVIFGMRYADAVSTDEEGRTTADLSRLSLMIPETEHAANFDVI